MIQRQTLLNDLKGVLKHLEADLRERAEPGGEAPDIHLALTAEYEKARAAERTAASFEEWRAEQMTQKAVAWILSCVFSRFLEDNGLVDPPRISGPGDRLQRARDEHELYFREHPLETDREYLLSGFKALATLPGGREIFGEHNAIHVFPGWLSGDAAGGLLSFFQKIDAGTGALVHDFTDAEWDTRFLGDLYQDLSEAARKKYALLQTPDFVEEFILDRTLEPALDEFGLNAPPVKNREGNEIALAGFRMIDPACGSGHFLLGAFDRIFERWLKKEPSGNSRDLAQRTLDSIHGVDINPFAVAIARFRLLLQAMKASGITRLKDCPNFQLNLACGDSLLHGEGAMQQMGFSFEPMVHCYETEDDQELRRILRIGIYHTVVANPPYITPKDPQQNKNIRARYDSCYRKYALNVPFMERIFQLAANQVSSKIAGYTGQITANSFMKREFGKKVIENHIPKWDITHIIDTSGTYIPGHGTPTVILFARNRQPLTTTVRTAMGVKGEPSTPEIPAKGDVWQSILNQIDRPGTTSEYVSVGDPPRKSFHVHPWSLGGGGAAQLKTFIDSAGSISLKDLCSSIGIFGIPNADDVMLGPQMAFRRYGVEQRIVVALVTGDKVRDWAIMPGNHVLFPYIDGHLIEPTEFKNYYRRLWPSRTVLGNRATFAKKTYFYEGRPWWDWHQVTLQRLQSALTIVNAFVATHNQFAITNSNYVFKQSSPIVKLASDCSNDKWYGVLGLLNSSTACFWLKQILHDKGGGGIGGGIASEAWERFREYTSSGIATFPLSQKLPNRNSKIADELSKKMLSSAPSKIVQQNFNAGTLKSSMLKYSATLKSLIYVQEELDWQVYSLYDLIDGEHAYNTGIVEIELGQRAFEIVMARKMAAGELETTWFERHNSTPITEIPTHWPGDYKQLVKKRIKAIEENPRTIGLIEQPEYKRRWNLEPWDSQLEKALRNWLLDRLESYFDFDGRMNDAGEITAKMDIGLTTTARLSDTARADENFMEVAEQYRKRPDFDVATLVAELVEAESVPLLPACRYKPTGMDKRTAWERTWRLQRIEDNIDALFDAKRLTEIDVDTLRLSLNSEITGIVTQLKNIHLINNGTETSENQEWLDNQVRSAFDFVSSDRKEGRNLDTDRIKQHLAGLAKAAKDHLVGDIPVPPKYTTKDFQSTVFWRLRGKLDVPKERWVSFPHCSGEDPSLLVAWAGYDHLQMAGAIAAHYMDIKEKTGGSDDPRLEVLLACLIELLPWLKQWHNDLDPEFNERMGDFYETFISEESRQMGKSVDEACQWQPPQPKRGR